MIGLSSDYDRIIISFNFYIICYYGMQLVISMWPNALSLHLRSIATCDTQHLVHLQCVEFGLAQALDTQVMTSVTCVMSWISLLGKHCIAPPLMDADTFVGQFIQKNIALNQQSSSGQLLKVRNQTTTK